MSSDQKLPTLDSAITSSDTKDQTSPNTLEMCQIIYFDFKLK